MAGSSERLFVTFIDTYNGLLKIWGQPNRTCGSYIEKQLLQLAPEFNRSSPPSPASVKKGMLFFAKYEDETYYRARIISDVLSNTVLVYFMDYGNKDRIDISSLRALNNPSDNIVTTIVAQAEEYYLANVKSDGGWSLDVLNEIRRALCFTEHKFRTVCQSGSEQLIQISYRNEDYSSYLIRQDLAKPVPVKEQMMLLRSTFKNQTMEALGSGFRGASFSQNVPQHSQHSHTVRDNFFMQNKVQLGPTPPEHINQPMQVSQKPLLPQSVFGQTQNRSGIINNDRHFNVMNPTQKLIFNPGGVNPVHSEAKSTPVINNVVIEALANQLKHHLLKDQLPPTPESSPSSQGYITQVLDVKTTHNVYVSYIDDGPWSFSVQLVSNEHELNQLMDDLAAYNFQPIKLPLVLGSPCIAKSRQYENYCRGVLVNITHSAVKVFFVDFGNTEDLPVNMLYEIPPKFFKFKTMSQKFSLSGLQRVKPTDEIKKAFVDVVENELLILHVTNLEGENLPTCDLYLKDTNIKRILNDKLRQIKSWEQFQFPRSGEIENVFVTHVESALKFYVRLKKSDLDLKDLKTELAKLGAIGEHFAADELVPGTICICFFTKDNNWHRSVVTSINSAKMVKVFFVDSGNTDEVEIKLLRKVNNSSITKLKTLAIPCRLQGFENEPFSATVKAAMTELILEKEFSLKVVSEEKDYIVVQLFDDGRDVSLCLKSITLISKQKPIGSDIRTKTESHGGEIDSVSRRNSGKSSYFIHDIRTKTESHGGEIDSVSRRNSGKSSYFIHDIRTKAESHGGEIDSVSRRNSGKSSYFAGGNYGSDRMDSGKSWRSDDAKRDFGLKTAKIRDSNDSNSDNDSNRNVRYNIRPRRADNFKSSDRGDQRHWDRNWRGTDSFEPRNTAGEGRSGVKLGESISERMKRAARENEERGLKLTEMVVTKLPVKLENIAFHGHQFEKKTVKIGSTEDVIVTYFVNPNEIYVQLVSDRDTFRDFMMDIHNYYSTKLPLLNKPKTGDVVVAKFQQDGVLYRAVVVDTDPITVRYVDFGNEEISEKENLWPMDKKFLELESQCVKCTLPNLKPVGSKTWPAPNSQMDRIFEYEVYSCTFLKKLGDVYEIKLIVSANGKNVRDELIYSGFAHSTEGAVESPAHSVREIVESPMRAVKETIESPSDLVEETMKKSDPLIESTSVAFDLVCGEVLNVFISCVIDVTEFFVHLNVNRVEAIEEEIRKFTLKGQLATFTGNNPQIGTLCLVRVKSGFWYRAKVLEKKTYTTVQLIDHGEEVSVSHTQVKGIPDHLAAYPPQAVKCSLLIDADMMDYRLNDQLAACNRQSYTALIHELSQDRLRVTLYNSKGEKLEFLDLDELGPTCIRPIAELPIINRRMEVKLTQIVTPKEIYVQIADDAGDIKRLSSLMSKFYSDSGNSKMEGDLSEYELYAVRSERDHLWYRAQLFSQSDKSAKMFYLDYGYYEDVPKRYIRKLDSSFYRMHAFAKKVSLNIKYDYDSEKDITDKIRKLIEEKACTGRFVKANDTIYAEFFVNNSSITSELVSDSVKELSMDYLLNAPIREWSEDINKVFIAHVSYPGAFWVHEERIISDLNDLQDKLQVACSEELSKENIEVGDILGAQFKDQLWYRSTVISMNDNIVSIRFLDYGNTYILDTTTSKLVPLSEELVKPPSFARKCSLKGYWKKTATPRFESIALSSDDTFTLIEMDDKVDLIQNGLSVTEQLIKEGHGQDESNNTVFITHINSTDDFHVQREIDQELFDIINDGLAYGDSLKVAVDVNLNELYAAKQAGNDMWHRAKVLAKDENGVAVEFIDYGNCCTLTDLRELFPPLKAIKPLGIVCCLATEELKGDLSEDAREYFQSLMNVSPLKMEVVEEKAEIKAVRLQKEDGEDIIETLIRLNKEARATPDPDPIDNEVIYVENGSLLCEENEICTENADSCSSEIVDNDAISNAENGSSHEVESSNSSDKDVSSPEHCAEKMFPESGCVKKLPHPKKKGQGRVSRGTSLEEVSSLNSETAEKSAQSSSSAPVTPSISRRQKKITKKTEREAKPLPGSILRGTSSSAWHSSDSDGDAAEKVNRATKGVQG